MWEYLGRYRRGHRLLGLLNNSLVAHSVLTLDAAGFDEHFQHTLNQFQMLHQELSRRGIGYIVGSFAAPDYTRATRSFQAYLDVDTAVWGKAMNLKHYQDYARLIDRYNRRFMTFTAASGMRQVAVHEQITEPDVFIDVCHMKSEGIRQLAYSFLRPVVQMLNERYNLPPAP
jgi:hypothetical protein